MLEQNGIAITEAADAKKRKLSFASPLARALIGKRKGSEIEVAAPGGARECKVLMVKWR
jgi:transcription elongation factor GreA